MVLIRLVTRPTGLSLPTLLTVLTQVIQQTQQMLLTAQQIAYQTVPIVLQTVQMVLHVEQFAHKTELIVLPIALGLITKLT